MAMYPPAYTWTESNPHHHHLMAPSHHMKMAPNQIMYQQPWPYYHNHPYHPPASCCNHASYYLPPPPNFYPHGFYPPFPSPSPFPPQPYYYPSPDLLSNYHHNNNNHTSHHCCHQEDDKRPKIKEESQADDDKLKKSHSSYVPVSVSPEPPVEMGQHEHGNHPFPFQIFWLPPKNDETGKDTTNNNKNLDLGTANKNVCPGTSKQAVQKVIPVKQLATNEEKKSTELMANSEKKTDGGSSRVSPKTSKLPPVCLRIDPLPRNKKSSSHSPKSLQQQAQVLKKNKEEKSEGNINTVELEHDNLGDNNMPRVKEVASSEKEQVEEEKKKNLSEHEPALIIQSRYRGFQVRKSQPLKKLRQIYEVRNLVSELRNRIQNLESSSSNIRVDGKEKVIIGETIMSLLLKLDTIQGLHPYVREVRKSVAKELVGLQEKLDSLTFIESETPSEEIVFSPQQVMHPEGDDDAIQKAKAQSGLCDNHEHNALCENGNDDDAQVYHNTPNLEKSTEDVVEDEFKHPQSDSNRVICENHEMEATKSQEGGCNPIVEAQMELHKEKMDDETTECEVEATKLQEGGCKPIIEPQMELHKEKMDDGTTECEVEATNLQEGGNTSGEPEMESHEGKFDECDHSRNEGHEVEGGENNGEEVVADMKLEHEVHVDSSSIQKAEVDSSNVETMIMYGSDDRKDDDGSMVEEMKSAAEEKQVPIGNEIERYEEVIRELAGRVKDLEKKLAKKKKIKVNKCNKRRTGGHMYNKTV